MSKQSPVHHFIDEERAKGKSDSAIRHQLLDAGWQMDLIQHAMEGTVEHLPTDKTIRTAAKRSVRELLIHPYIIGAIFLIIILSALFI